MKITLRNRHSTQDKKQIIKVFFESNCQKKKKKRTEAIQILGKWKI
jgi:hypothetical protein